MVYDDARPVVLLTEDNALVGLDLRDTLEAAGYRVAGPFVRTTDALFWLARETPDLALLDVMLADGPSNALAHALRESGVPFVVYSGRRPSDTFASDFVGAPWLDKSAKPDVIANRLGELTSASPVQC